MMVTGKTREIKFRFDGDDENDFMYEGWYGGDNMAGIDVFVTFETLADLVQREIGLLNSADVGLYSEGYFVNLLQMKVVERSQDRIAPYDGPFILVADSSFQEVASGV